MTTQPAEVKGERDQVMRRFMKSPRHPEVIRAHQRRNRRWFFFWLMTYGALSGVILSLQRGPGGSGHNAELWLSLAFFGSPLIGATLGARAWKIRTWRNQLRDAQEVWAKDAEGAADLIRRYHSEEQAQLQRRLDERAVTSKRLSVSVTALCCLVGVQVFAPMSHWPLKILHSNQSTGLERYVVPLMIYHLILWGLIGLAICGTLLLVRQYRAQRKRLVILYEDRRAARLLFEESHHGDPLRGAMSAPSQDEPGRVSLIDERSAGEGEERQSLARGEGL